MMVEISLALIIGLITWLLGAWIHRLPVSGKIQVPLWIARFCGSPTHYVDPKMFSIQLLGLGTAFWLVFVVVIDSSHEHREIVVPGCIVLIVVISLASIFLSRFGERNN